MSPTTKPPEHLSPAKAYDLQPATKAAQFEAAGAAAKVFGWEAGEVADVVVAGRGEPAETARLGRFPVSLRSSGPDLMRIGLGGEGMFAPLARRMRGPDMHVAAKWVVKVIRKR